MGISVRQKIIERILREGPITFKAFMEMALYEPGAGYYTRPQTEIGKAGDFYTGPHLHPAFGWMLAKQLEEMWCLLGRGAFHVTEQGPGKGYMAKDILDGIKGRNAEFYDSVSYRLVELNPALRQFQQGLLDEHAGKVSWADALKADAGPVNGAVLANELLDAFPVHLVQMDGGEAREVMVDFKDGAFVEALSAVSTDRIEEYLKMFSPGPSEGQPGMPGGELPSLLPDGYRTEVNLALRDWLLEVSGVLRKGFVLVVDYGYPAWDYYSPERDRGTLLCYYRHRVVEDPYVNVGEMDMTAHVNFSALKVFGEEAGFRCAGFCPQGTYLVSLGIEEVLASLDQAGILKLKGLLLPGTMGGTHKVMALYKGPGGGNVPELKGFEMRNQCRVL